MSKIEVDKIDPQSGTDLELGTSGDTITIPAGVTFDSSAATNTLPATVVTTTGTQTLTNKNIVASQLTGTVATSNLGTGTADSTTFLRGDQTYASATPAANSITTAQLAYNPNAFRNIIINGDMSIAQRGTSSSGITAGNYTVDRFRYSKAGTSPTFTISQDTTVPSGQGFSKSLKLEVTTTNATTAAEWGIIEQKFEGQNLQYLKKGTANAESLTLSFWVKASKTGTYIIRLDDNDNARQICKSYTIDTADTWEKKTLTFAGDTSGTLDNDNAQSLSVEWCLFAGTDYTSGTLATSWESNTNANSYVGQVDAFDTVNNTFFLTGVQLEAGTSASDFEFLPFDVNLARCRRYFETNFAIGTAPANGVSFNITDFYSDLTAFTATDARITVPFKVTKRATPTITLFNVTGLSSGTTAGKWQLYDGGWTESSGTTHAAEVRNGTVQINLSDSYTIGRSYLVGGGFTASAEL